MYENVRPLFPDIEFPVTPDVRAAYSDDRLAVAALAMAVRGESAARSRDSAMVCDPGTQGLRLFIAASETCGDDEGVVYPHNSLHVCASFADLRSYIAVPKGTRQDLVGILRRATMLRLLEHDIRAYWRFYRGIMATDEALESSVSALTSAVNRVAKFSDGSQAKPCVYSCIWTSEMGLEKFYDVTGNIRLHAKLTCPQRRNAVPMDLFDDHDCATFKRRLSSACFVTPTTVLLLKKMSPARTENVWGNCNICSELVFGNNGGQQCAVIRFEDSRCRTALVAGNGMDQEIVLFHAGCAFKAVLDLFFARDDVMISAANAIKFATASTRVLEPVPADEHRSAASVHEATAFHRDAAAAITNARALLESMAVKVQESQALNLHDFRAFLKEAAVDWMKEAAEAVDLAAAEVDEATKVVDEAAKAVDEAAKEAAKAVASVGAQMAAQDAPAGVLPSLTTTSTANSTMPTDDAAAVASNNSAAPAAGSASSGSAAAMLDASAETPPQSRRRTKRLAPKEITGAAGSRAQPSRKRRRREGDTRATSSLPAASSLIEEDDDDDDDDFGDDDGGNGADDNEISASASDSARASAGAGAAVGGGGDGDGDSDGGGNSGGTGGGGDIDDKAALETLKNAESSALQVAVRAEAPARSEKMDGTISYAFNAPVRICRARSPRLYLFGGALDEKLKSSIWTTKSVAHSVAADGGNVYVAAHFDATQKSLFDLMKEVGKNIRGDVRYESSSPEWDARLRGVLDEMQKKYASSSYVKEHRLFADAFAREPTGAELLEEAAQASHNRRRRCKEANRCRDELLRDKVLKEALTKMSQKSRPMYVDRVVTPADRDLIAELLCVRVFVLRNEMQHPATEQSDALRADHSVTLGADNVPLQPGVASMRALVDQDNVSSAAAAVIAAANGRLHMHFANACRYLHDANESEWMATFTNATDKQKRCMKRLQSFVRRSDVIRVSLYDNSLEPLTIDAIDRYAGNAFERAFATIVRLLSAQCNLPSRKQPPRGSSRYLRSWNSIKFVTR